MLLAETRTITNTSQAKQVTWEEVVAEFAGFVQIIRYNISEGQINYRHRKMYGFVEMAETCEILAFFHSRNARLPVNAATMLMMYE